MEGGVRVIQIGGRRGPQRHHHNNLLPVTSAAVSAATVLGRNSRRRRRGGTSDHGEAVSFENNNVRCNRLEAATLRVRKKNGSPTTTTTTSSSSVGTASQRSSSAMLTTMMTTRSYKGSKYDMNDYHEKRGQIEETSSSSSTGVVGKNVPVITMPTQTAIGPEDLRKVLKSILSPPYMGGLDTKYFLRCLSIAIVKLREMKMLNIPSVPPQHHHHHDSTDVVETIVIGPIRGHASDLAAMIEKDVLEALTSMEEEEEDTVTYDDTEEKMKNRSRHDDDDDDKRKGQKKKRKCFVFLGDLIDGGQHSVDVLCLVLSMLIVLPPGDVVLIRGAHEHLYPIALGCTGPHVGRLEEEIRLRSRAEARDLLLLHGHRSDPVNDDNDEEEESIAAKKYQNEQQGVVMHDDDDPDTSTTTIAMGKTTTTTPKTISPIQLDTPSFTSFAASVQENIDQLLKQLFALMCIGAVVDHRYFCVSSGISPHFKTIDEINRLPRRKCASSLMMSRSGGGGDNNNDVVNVKDDSITNHQEAHEEEGDGDAINLSAVLHEEEQQDDDDDGLIAKEGHADKEEAAEEEERGGGKQQPSLQPTTSSSSSTPKVYTQDEIFDLESDFCLSDPMDDDDEYSFPDAVHFSNNVERGVSYVYSFNAVCNFLHHHHQHDASPGVEEVAAISKDRKDDLMMIETDDSMRDANNNSTPIEEVEGVESNHHHHHVLHSNNKTKTSASSSVLLCIIRGTPFPTVRGGSGGGEDSDGQGSTTNSCGRAWHYQYSPKDPGYKCHRKDPQTGFPSVIALFSAPQFCGLNDNIGATVRIASISTRGEEKGKENASSSSFTIEQHGKNALRPQQFPGPVENALVWSTGVFAQSAKSIAAHLLFDEIIPTDDHDDHQHLEGDNIVDVDGNVARFKRLLKLMKSVRHDEDGALQHGATEEGDHQSVIMRSGSTTLLDVFLQAQQQ